MHEIVHISHGPRANYLNTEFYNRQTEYFVFTDVDVANSFVDPSVRFAAGSEYTPRAVFWEFRGGFGTKARYSSVYEQQETQESIESDVDAKVERIRAGPAVEKEYLKSWTDLLKPPIHPRTENELVNWDFDPESIDGRLRGAGEPTRFLSFEQGEAEYKQIDKDHNGEYLDETIRYTLEKCDAISGINLCTDTSGWGGFSAIMLEELRDNFSQKLPIFTWAQVSDSSRQSRRVIDTQLSCYTALSEYSSLLIPLTYAADLDLPGNATNQSILYETVGLLSSLRQGKVTMDTLQTEITAGTQANIVAGSFASSFIKREDPVSYFSRGSTTKISSFESPQFAASSSFVKAKLGILRATGSALLTQKDVDLQWKSFAEDALVEAGTSDFDLHKYDCPQPLLDSTASAYISGSGLLAQLELNNGPLSLRKVVAPWNHEQKDQIYNLTDAYVWQWTSDSDYD